MDVGGCSDVMDVVVVINVVNGLVFYVWQTA